MGTTSAELELVLHVLKEPLSIARLSPDDRLPGWLDGDSWHSVTRTADELSVVCPSRLIPAGVQCVGPWRAMQVAGPLDFALTGILSRITAPLAQEEISVFAVSTYDTDYVLVREEDVERATARLMREGIVVQLSN